MRNYPRAEDKALLRLHDEREDVRIQLSMLQDAEYLIRSGSGNCAANELTSKRGYSGTIALSWTNLSLRPNYAQGRDW